MDIEEVSSETKCSLIKQTLNKIRQSITGGNNSDDDVLEPFQHLIQLRELFRDVVFELQARKELAGNQKQQIEKKVVQLDGLEYCKVMLNAEISLCKVDVVDVSDIIEEELDVQWTNGFQQIKDKLLNWIQDSKSSKQILNEKKIEMQKTETKIQTKKDLYKNQLPLQLKKISENLISLTGMFGVEPVYLLNPVQHPKLKAIYNYFQPLKESKAIAMEYTDETISIKINLSTTHPIYNFFHDIKCPIEEKNVEINFLVILNNTLVISVSRSSDFNNEEIFNRLINNQPTTKLFQNPKTEEERNNNNRFVRFKWLDNIVNTGQNLQMSSYSLFKKIEDRIITLMITRYLLLSMKDNRFFFYFRVIRQGQNGTVHLKKFNIQSLTKISAKQFQKTVYVPYWAQNIRQIQGSRVQNNLQTAHSSEYLTDLNYQQNQQSPKNQYYKIALNYYQNIIVFVIIIPFNYPQKQSVFKILEITKKKDERRVSNLPNKLLVLDNPVVGMSIMNEIKNELLEKQLNEGIKDIVKDNYQFIIFYQINRLFTMLEESVATESNSEFTVTKMYDF